MSCFSLTNYYGLNENSNRLLKLAIIGKYMYPLDTRLSQEVKMLAKNGFETDVFCINNGDLPATEDFGRIHIHRLIKISERKKGFYTYISTLLLFPFKIFLKLAVNFCKAEKYSVIIIHTLPEILVFVSILQKALGARIILDARDLSVELIATKCNGILLCTFKPLLLLFEKISCTFCDEIITASTGFRNRLIERGINPNKISVVVNTADCQIFKYSIKKSFSPIVANTALVYHGSVAERFGVLLAIEAVALINNEIPNSKLNIYGVYETSYLKKIEHRISELGLNNFVFLNDWKPLHEIYTILKSTDIGLVPYLDTDFMNIAFSTKMFEYAATGVPIVASRLKAPTSIFNSTCIAYFEPGNPASLAKEVIRLCSNPNERKNCICRAFDVYKQHDSDKMMLRFLNVVEKCTH